MIKDPSRDRRSKIPLLREQRKRHHEGTCWTKSYTWFFGTWFLGGPEIVDFGGTGGPGGQTKTLQTVRGFAPHLWHLWGWFLGPPGPHKPQKSTISSRPKNHVLQTQVYVFNVFLGSAPSRFLNRRFPARTGRR